MTSNLPTAIDWNNELKGAAALLKSGLVPRDLKTPESCLFVILAGRDLGLSPVQSLRSIRPIQGKIECSADLQLGLFHRDGGKSHWKILTETEVELELTAPWLIGAHVSRWTMEDAKRAGLHNNDNYKKYPRPMLRSRAITAGLKDIGYFQGQASGVYAPGELSGQAVVDCETGEVLPTEDQQTSEMAQLPKPQQTSAGEGALSGLDDDLALRIIALQGDVNAAWLAKDPDKAYAIYKDTKKEFQDIGNADAFVAFRNGLDSKMRKTFREMASEELKQSIQRGVPLDDEKSYAEAFGDKPT